MPAFSVLRFFPMIPETLKDHLHAAPFKPFTVCVAGSEIVEIPHADFAALLHAGRILVVNTEDNKLKHIDVRLISTITSDADPE